eukprot:2199330-Rhodomonas_salina.6
MVDARVRVRIPQSVPACMSQRARRRHADCTSQRRIALFHFDTRPGVKGAKHAPLCGPKEKPMRTHAHAGTHEGLTQRTGCVARCRYPAPRDLYTARRSPCA